MAEERPSWAQEEEDDEEDLDETSYIQQKDAVLFAIDVSASMLRNPPPSEAKNAETDSPTLAALKCAYRIMEQRIISSPKDMMGVLLFGTEKTKFQDEGRSSLAYPHCYLLADLDIPSADDVKTLKNIVEDEDEAAEILQPAEDDVSMSNVLFCANQIFTTRAPTFGSRRLFIITDNDDPHSSDKNARSQATVRAKDLYDLGCIIELFPISHPEHEFDRTKFYDDIIYRDPEAPADVGLVPTSFKAGGSGISLLNDLISDVNSKQIAKRALFNVSLEIGPNFKISVKGYNLLHKQAPARGCYVWDKGEQFQIPVGRTQLTSDTSEKPVEKVEIKKAYKFAGEQILFKPEEQKQLKTWEPPIIRIIGFKPQSLLPIWASVKKSTFIYPTEEHFIGSTRVFSALWSKLRKDKIMGVAWHIARSNAAPTLVAILPSEERLDATTNHQIAPAGLWLYQLPFADDLRNLPPTGKPIVAPDALIDEMRTIIGMLHLPKGLYEPSKYPNRNLQWHYKLLQVSALAEETPEEFEDKSEPKYRQIQKRAGHYINKWSAILEDEIREYKDQAYKDELDSKPTKRGQDEVDSDDEKPKKKIKTEKSSQKPSTQKGGALDSLSNDEVKKLIQKGTLSKHSVPELKDWLSSKGEKTIGKKADLVERVEQWIESN